MTLNMLYIDPAATSMLLSSITAIVVACGAGIFMAWRSMKKKVKKAFHIDENANKEMEDELVINDEVADDDNHATDAKTTKKTTTKKQVAKTASPDESK